MGLSNLVISVRAVTLEDGRKVFTNEPGPTMYLDVPDGEMPDPVAHEIDRRGFIDKILERADTGRVERPNANREQVSLTTGDVLIFVHGYNNGADDIMTRHNLLQENLEKHEYEGAIVSFDWPSAESTLNYLEDRRDAKATALRLVDDGIRTISALQKDQQERRCEINVHLLGHSTGAYVIREAFADADQSAAISRTNWTASQIVFIGGDISTSSLAHDNDKSQALFRHGVRITNYSNRNDNALKISNVKRLGMAPRVGRVGIPDDAHPKCVDVDCSEHWEELKKKKDEEEASKKDEAPGNFSHSWHFADPLFSHDLAETLKGDVDRKRIKTRGIVDGRLTLKKP